MSFETAFISPRRSLQILLGSANLTFKKEKSKNPRAWGSSPRPGIHNEFLVKPSRQSMSLIFCGYELLLCHRNDGRCQGWLSTKDSLTEGHY